MKERRQTCQHRLQKNINVKNTNPGSDILEILRNSPADNQCLQTYFSYWAHGLSIPMLEVRLKIQTDDVELKRSVIGCYHL